MDIEKLARKLEPLIPDQVQHWLRVRDLADPELKGLIEKEIVSTAYELLGDFRKKPLFSLPPKKKSKGSIHLGKILYNGEKWDFGISQPELLRNMAILGMSGSGKTNLAFHILRQLVEKRVRFLFWDWKRSARHLLPDLRGKVNLYTPGRRLSPFPFNPFIVPPGLEPSVYINHVVDVMADAFTLGDGSRRILQKAISACYRAGNHAPTVADVLAKVEEVPSKERVTGWKISATRALESLAFSRLSGADCSAQEAFARDLLHQSTIIELDGLAQGAKKFLIPLLCLWIYFVQLASPRREQLNLVIFVEEAHHVLYRQEARAKESALGMLFRQCREIGIGMVVIDQHPHLVSSAALGNTYTTLCLNQRDPTDINKAAALSLVGDQEKKWFSMFPVGQAVAKLQDRWRRPVLLQVPHVKVRKGAVNDDLLSRFLDGRVSVRGLRREVKRTHGQGPKALSVERPLSDEVLGFLHDVLQHEDDGIRVRYKRLRLSGDKGNGLKNQLVDQGILEEQQVKVGRTYKVLLRVTPHARSKLGLKKTLGRGSLAHEYWKRFYASAFRDKGYQIQVEAPRPAGGGGRVDVLAKKAGEITAVEIETGKSEVVWNVRQDLRSGCKKVLVVATDEDALRKVEIQLARAGLVIPGRIDLGLKDDSLRAA